MFKPTRGMQMVIILTQFFKGKILNDEFVKVNSKTSLRLICQNIQGIGSKFDVLTEHHRSEKY